MGEITGLQIYTTPEEYLQFVKIMLGGTDIDIELNLEDISVVLSLGLTFLNTYRANYAPTREVTITIPETGDVLLPSNAIYIKKIHGIGYNLETSFRPPLSPGSLFMKKMMGDLAIMGNQFMGTTIQGYFGYFQEMNKILFGTSVWYVEGRKLIIRPKPASGNQYELVYAEGYTLNNLNINTYNAKWMKEFVLEMSKEIINRKRNFAGNNLPILEGAITLETLEHSKTIQELEEEISKTQKTHPAALMGGMY